jgi:hypothetical protein
MLWVPLFVYDYDPETGLDGVEFECSIPQRPWEPFMDTTGGHKVSAAGVPEAYVVRRDSLLKVKLRIWEFEWPGLWAMISWMQDTASEARFHPVRGEPAVAFYLEEPVAGQKLTPTRGEAYGTYDVEITIRRVDGAVSDLRYFGDLGT